MISFRSHILINTTALMISSLAIQFTLVHQVASDEPNPFDSDENCSILDESCVQESSEFDDFPGTVVPDTEYRSDPDNDYITAEGDNCVGYPDCEKIPTIVHHDGDLYSYENCERWTNEKNGNVMCGKKIECEYIKNDMCYFESKKCELERDEKCYFFEIQ